MVQGKNNTYSPTLLKYISHFKNYLPLASISDQDILIGYFSASIPSPLMRHIMSMDTVPTTIDNWYKKAISFQTQWECAEEIIKQNAKLAHQSYQSFSTPTKACDPDAMDVDIIKVSKLTPKEHKKCIEKDFVSTADNPDTYVSTKCPHFKKNLLKVWQVTEDQG